MLVRIYTMLYVSCISMKEERIRQLLDLIFLWVAADWHWLSSQRGNIFQCYFQIWLTKIILKKTSYRLESLARRTILGKLLPGYKIKGSSEKILCPQARAPDISTQYLFKIIIGHRLIYVATSLPLQMGIWVGVIFLLLSGIHYCVSHLGWEVRDVFQ